MSDDIKSKRLVVVSNRLPVAIQPTESGWKVKPSPGGLVTALAPVVARTGGMWIGWPGCPDTAPAADLLAEYNRDEPFRLIPVAISEQEISRYYRGFSNRTIWPLFHDLLGRFSFDLAEYRSFLDVNRRFAEVLAEQIDDDCVVWVHDYQLLFVGHYLRELSIKQHLHFFLHIPFPAIDLLRRLPRKTDLMRALLCYDHIGFQTPTDHRNFVNSVKWLLPETKRTTRRRHSRIQYRSREVTTGFYPISIDYQEFNQEAKAKEVADAVWYLRENFNTPVLALGLDRLDYTKGIPERFLAFERMLEKYPETQTKISLVQVVVPSRLRVPDYQDLKAHLDAEAGRINSRFSRQAWVPIHYLFRELDRVQLLGHYRACEIALITPLRDGMNLVAKEFCASSVDDNGVIILSEFAGAAVQLAKGALVVNPYDVEATADAINDAFHMPLEERQRRMKILRSEVKRNDVDRWVNWILAPNRDEETAQLGWLSEADPRESERREAD